MLYEVITNKIDRPEQRAHEVVDEVFDLLASLGADDRQLDAARHLLLAARSAATPVGIVRHACRPDEELIVTRITSYNVCYTKLLRTRSPS